MRKTCNICSKRLTYANVSGFCITCFIEQRRTKVLEKWLETGDTGMSVSTTVRGTIREYIEEQQSHRCAICNIPNNWNDKLLNFILDHVDGNAANNNQNNLRLICPNCDSQLATFKSRNKNSARKFRSK